MESNMALPYVRYARRMSERDIQLFLHPVAAVDHRLFVCATGVCTVHTGGVSHLLQPGNALFLRAGMPYCYTGGTPFSAYAFNFDFTDSHASLSVPIPPVPLAAFSPADVLEQQDPAAVPDFAPVMEVYAPELLFTAQTAEREYRHRRLFAAQRLSLLMADLLLCFFRATATEKLPQAADMAQQIAAYVRVHYREKCDNAAVGKAFAYSPNYINRLFKAYTGVPLHQYVLRCRMEQAMALLQTTRQPVEEISAAVGFYDAAHFTRAFLKFAGKTPGEYRFKGGK